MTRLSLPRLRALRAAWSHTSGTVRLNCLAALITASAFCVLVLNFQARPAGASGELPIAPAVPAFTASIPQVSAANDPATASGLTGLNTQELQARIQSAVHSSRVALELHVALLELGRLRIEKIPDYTATFVKQERLDSAGLTDMQTMQLKLRHQPYSVYMKWLEGGDEGREILYVGSDPEGKMLVKLGGLKGKLMPQLKLEPNSDLALSEARHPVTEMGLLHLCDLLVKYRKRDLALKSGCRWQLVEDQKFGDRDCFCFVVEYDSAEIEPVYRKSIVYIDRELSIPVCVRNFGWPEEGVELTGEPLDEETLIEYYGYADIRFDERLADSEFDKTHKDYSFKR